MHNMEIIDFLFLYIYMKAIDYSYFSDLDFTNNLYDQMIKNDALLQTYQQYIK